MAPDTRPADGALPYPPWYSVRSPWIVDHEAPGAVCLTPQDIRILGRKLHGFTVWPGLVGRLREELVELWDAEGTARARLAAAVAHALRFETWRSLARAEALGDAEAADLMVSLARAAVDPRGNQLTA